MNKERVSCNKTERNNTIKSKYLLKYGTLHEGVVR